MHFTSLHALIKAVTSVGHTKEGSYLHTHAKTHISTHVHSHTHLWQHNNWAYISWIWVTGTQSVHILWCVIRLLDFLECNAIQEGNFRLAKSYQENNLALVNGYYRFAQDSGWDTVFTLHLNLPKCLYCFIVFNLYSLWNANKCYSLLFYPSLPSSSVISNILTCNIKVLIIQTHMLTHTYTI